MVAVGFLLCNTGIGELALTDGVAKIVDQLDGQGETSLEVTCSLISVYKYLDNIYQFFLQDFLKLHLN